MEHQLPKLLFKQNALEPFISSETIHYHYDRHHRAYLTRLGELIAETEFANKPLDTIIKHSTGIIQEIAIQAWNHNFYWQCITPGGSGKPKREFSVAIDHHFGSIQSLKKQFSKASQTIIGSGWVWLVKNPEKNLSVIVSPQNKDPITDEHIPLLVCDLWEHAYYIDYRDNVESYLESFWNVLNWDFVSGRFQSKDSDL